MTYRFRARKVCLFGSNLNIVVISKVSSWDFIAMGIVSVEKGMWF